MPQLNLPIANRAVAEQHIRLEIQKIVELCSPAIGLPAKMTITVARSSGTQFVTVSVDATWQ